jgi:hypothetical protein
MGGEHTEKVEQPSAAPESATESHGAGKQSIEIHQKGHEVHFHDRTSGLKAAMPVADWYSAWRRLEHAEVGKEEFTYFDETQETRLQVTTAWASDFVDMLGIFARIKIEKVGRVNEAYTALRNFMRRSKGG